MHVLMQHQPFLSSSFQCCMKFKGPTMDELARRGIQINSTVWLMCGSETESGIPYVCVHALTRWMSGQGFVHGVEFPPPLQLGETSDQSSKLTPMSNTRKKWIHAIILATMQFIWRA